MSGAERFFPCESWGLGLGVLIDSWDYPTSPVTMPLMQRYLIGKERDRAHLLESWEEKDVNGLKFSFGTFHLDVKEKELKIPKTKIVIGSYAGQVLFTRASYTRRVYWEDSYEVYPDIPVVSQEETVEWNIFPEGGAIQRAVYNPNVYSYSKSDTYTPSDFPPFTCGDIGLGFSNLFTPHYQLGYYREGLFKDVKYCEMPIPWTQDKPLPFYLVMPEQPDDYKYIRQHKLNTKVQIYNGQVLITESLNGNPVQAFTLPERIRIAKWRRVLKDRSDHILYDSGMPYLRWFNELGIMLEIYKTHFAFEEA